MRTREDGERRRCVCWTCAMETDDGDEDGLL